MAMNTLMKLINQADLGKMKEKMLKDGLDRLKVSNDENLLIWLENLEIMLQSSFTKYKNHVRYKHPFFQMFLSQNDFLLVILERLNILVDSFSNKDISKITDPLTKGYIPLQAIF